MITHPFEHLFGGDLRQDPLLGAYGLAWFERKPRSLSYREWHAIRKALADGRISARDYAEWVEYVR